MPARPISGTVQDPIPRYRAYRGPAVLAAGFRPFFLAAALWAAVAVPLWLAAYAGGLALASGLDPIVWHAHEMVYGFVAAAAAGFIMTMVPNWTGRMPLQGMPLLLLVLLWAAGRLGILLGGWVGAPLAAAADLSFPTLFLAAVAREVIAGRNWRNLPILGALVLLLLGNGLVHGAALGLTPGTAALGNRIGIATFLMLIALVGGRLVPSFTRNWLAKRRAGGAPVAAADRLDQAALGVTALGWALWVPAPEAAATGWAMLAAGVLLLLRLRRWQGWRTASEPLLLILHLGYAWLGIGVLLLGIDRAFDLLPPAAALHALTAGAVGTMTLAVMTRTTLSQTGRRGSARRGTSLLILAIGAAALLRILAPLAGAGMMPVLWLSGLCWSAAFLGFAVGYGPLLLTSASSGKR
ncbi:NnrS family protein [Dongia sp. agr-C8]